MNIHLTKDELQELWRIAMEGEEAIEINGFKSYIDIDHRDMIILNYTTDYPYAQAEGKFTNNTESGQNDITFLEDVTFEPYDWPNGVTLDVDELKHVDRGDGQEHMEGWYIEWNVQSGWYDSEKSAHCDYEGDLYDSDGNYLGTGKGDNYCHRSDHTFYGPITFKKPPPPTKTELLYNSIVNSIEGEKDMKTIIWKLKKIIEKYEEVQ